jgi:F-type H+-transporting ATPase subunit b
MRITLISRVGSKANLKALIVAALVVLVVASAGTVYAASEGGGHGWVATDTYRVMNFSVLLIALVLLLRKPIAQALGARIKGIKDQLEELEAKKREAEVELARYNERLAMLDQESDKIMQDYIKQGEAAKAKIIEQAQSTAAKLQEQAKRNIEHEINQTKKALQAEVLARALQQAEAQIKASISADDQDRLVDEYLEKVVA